MYNSDYFKRMQDDFYQTYGRTLNLQSSQVLYSSFHPVMRDGNYIIQMEEILQPPGLDLKQLNVPPQLDDHLLSYKVFARGATERVSSFMPSTPKRKATVTQNQKQGTTHIKRASYLEHWNKNAGNEDTAREDPNVIQMDAFVPSVIPIVQRVSPKSDLKDRFLKALADKIMKMAQQRLEQLEKQRQLEELQVKTSAAMKTEARGPERNFTYPFELIPESFSQFAGDDHRVRISIWRLDPVYEALQVNSVEINFKNEFHIYQNRIFFSNNGEYIFLFLVSNYDQELQKVLFLKSKGLELIRELPIDNLALEVEHLHSEPQMICVLTQKQTQSQIDLAGTDEVTLENNFIMFFPLKDRAILVSRLGKEMEIMYNLNDHSKNPRYVIQSMLFGCWNHDADIQPDKLASLSNRVTFIVRTKDKELKIIHTSLIKLREQMGRSQGTSGLQLNLDSEIIDQYTVSLDEDIPLEKYNVLAQRDLEMKNLILTLTEVQQDPINGQLQGPKALNYIAIIPQSNNSAMQIGNSDTNKESKQIIISSKNDFFLHQHLHLISNQDLHVSFFNDKEKSYVAMKLHQLKKVPEVEVIGSVNLSNFMHCKLNLHQHNIDSNFFDFKAPNNFNNSMVQMLSVQKQKTYFNIVLLSSFEQDICASERALDRYQFIYLNPYLIVVENGTLATIYSLYNKGVAFQFKIPGRFIKFVEMSGGSISIGDQAYYRHATCMFLTVDDEHFQCLQILHLPSIQNQKQVQGHNPSFRLTSLTSEAIIDWKMQKNQRILKVIFGQIKSGMGIEKSTIYHYMIYQLDDAVIIKDLNKPGVLQFYKTGGTQVPMIQQENLKSIALKVHKYFIHTVNDDLSQQQFKMIQITCTNKGLDCALKEVFIEKLAQKIIKIDYFNETFYTLDQSLTTKTYVMELTRDKLKFIQETKLLEEASFAYERYKDNAAFYHFSESGVFIGPVYYQSLTQSQFKDGNLDFENYRFKFIHTMNPLSLMIGPIASQDKSRLIYLHFETESKLFTPAVVAKLSAMEDKKRRKQEDTEGDMEQSPKINTAINRFRSSQMFFEEEEEKESKQSQFSRKSGNRSSKVLETEKKNSIFEEANDSDFSEDPPSEVEENDFANLDAFEIPLHCSQELQVIHKDDFIIDHVETTSFTSEDHIMVLLKNRNILVFDITSKPVEVQVTEQVKEALQDEQDEWKCVQLRFVGTGIGKGLALLFQRKVPGGLKIEFRLMKLTWVSKLEAYKYELVKDFDPIELNDTHVFIDGKITNSEQLNVLLVYSDGETIFYKNGQLWQHIEQVLAKALSTKESDEDMFNKNLENGRKNHTEMTERLLSRTQTLKEDQTKIKSFEVIHDKYLLFNFKNEIYYVDYQAAEPPVKQIDLQLNEGLITQILQTQSNIMVQFVFEQYKPEDLKGNFVITWNLELNQEVQILRLPYDQTLRHGQQMKIYKGVTEKLNYYLPLNQAIYYDLRYDFPNCLFNGQLANFKTAVENLQTATMKAKKARVHTQLTEVKIASYGKAVLGISLEKSLTIQNSYKFVNLEYMEYLLARLNTSSAFQQKEMQIQQILLSFCKFQLFGDTKKHDGDNIIHVLKQSTSFLKMFRKEINSSLISQDNLDYINFIYLTLVKNAESLSPLQICVEDHQTKEVEAMLKILLLRPKNDYFVHLRKYFFKLLEMNIPTFQKFLDECTYNVLFDGKINWTFERNQQFFTNSNSYLSQDFINKKFKHEQAQKSRERSLRNRRIVKQIQTAITSRALRYFKKNEEKDNSLAIIDSDLEEPTYFTQLGDIVTTNRSTVIKGFNFGWLLKGNAGIQFISYLGNQKSDSYLFESDTVKTIIQTQWNQFKKQYLMWEFIPGLIYQVLLFAFYSKLNPDTWTEEYRVSLSNAERSKMKLVHNYIMDVLFVPVSYFIILEFLKLMRTRHFLCLVHLAFHIAVCINVGLNMHYHGTQIRLDNPNIVRGMEFLDGIVILWSYYILLLQLRIFETTANLISVIFWVIQGTWNFLIVFFLANFGFAISIYLLDMTQDPMGDNDKMTGQNIWQSFLTTYQYAIGQQNTGDFLHLEFYSVGFNIYYIVWTFLMQVVLMNLIIAMFNDIYSQMTAAQKTERWRAKCRLIQEDEFIFRRNIIFSGVKYILKANLDQNDTSNAIKDTNVGIINTIVTRVRSALISDYEGVQSYFKEINRKFKKANAMMIDSQNQILQAQEQIKIQLGKKALE